MSALPYFHLPRLGDCAHLQVSFTISSSIILPNQLNSCRVVARDHVPSIRWTPGLLFLPSRRGRRGGARRESESKTLVSTLKDINKKLRTLIAVLGKQHGVTSDLPSPSPSFVLYLASLCTHSISLSLFPNHSKLLWPAPVLQWNQLNLLSLIR